MLRDKLKEDMKAAMKAGDKPRLGTIRLMLAAIQQGDIQAETVPGGKPLDEAGLVQALTRMVKQRRDSAEQFTAGGRQELATAELAEIAVIETYLPKQMDEAEMKAAIAAAIKTTGAAGVKDMGKVMTHLKAQHAGSMDFGKANGFVKAALG